MAAPLANPRTVVSREVESFLGPEIILAWAHQIETRPLPCSYCEDWTDPDGDDLVAVSAAVLESEDEDLRPTIEVFLCHERCGNSRVVDFTPGRVATLSPEGPPSLSITKPTGIRAVMLWGMYGMRLAMPVGDRQAIDISIRKLIRLGCRLVTCPPLEFEEPIEDWSLHVEESGAVEIRGPEPLVMSCSAPSGAEPNWLQAIAEQQRAVIIGCTLMTGDGFLTDQHDPMAGLLALLDQQRMEGHLVGGVVPATVHPLALARFAHALPPVPERSDSSAHLRCLRYGYRQDPGRRGHP